MRDKLINLMVMRATYSDAFSISDHHIKQLLKDESDKYQREQLEKQLATIVTHKGFIDEFVDLCSLLLADLKHQPDTEGEK